MKHVALLELAVDRGIVLNEDAAGFLIASRGRLGAETLVAGAAALIDLASAIGHDLDQAGAFRRIDAAGGYELAAERIIAPERQRRSRAFGAEWSRLEKAYYSSDAWGRHAVFVGHLAGGSLGWQTSMLLQAARDAALTAPGERELRARLTRIVGAEIGRRYPVRREAEWQVVGEDTAKHAELVRAEIRREQQARDLVLGRRPELAQRIDALQSGRLVHDVNKILRGVRQRLAKRANEGWVADPERYEREVVNEAAHAVREAS